MQLLGIGSIIIRFPCLNLQNAGKSLSLVLWQNHTDIIRKKLIPIYLLFKNLNYQIGMTHLMRIHSNVTYSNEALTDLSESLSTGNTASLTVSTVSTWKGQGIMDAEFRNFLFVCRPAPDALFVDISAGDTLGVQRGDSPSGHAQRIQYMLLVIYQIHQKWSFNIYCTCRRIKSVHIWLSRQVC